MDDELLTLTARGHHAAFAELYDLTSPLVYGVVLRVLRSRDHAAEVTQEVYLQLWQQADRYDSRLGSAKSWVITLAHRRAVDRVRTVINSYERDQRWALRHYEQSHDQAWAGVEQQLDLEMLDRALASLTTIQREAIDLAYFGGYTQPEIASRLHVPLGTVKTRIRDALIGLRNALGARPEAQLVAPSGATPQKRTRS